MTPSELKKKLPDLAGGYLFYGEEEYLKSFYLGEVRRAVVSDSALDAFNRTVLSGREGLSALDSAVLTAPFMSEKKLIELHSVDYASLTKDELDALCSCLDAAKSSGDTVIVMYAEDEECRVQNKKRPPVFFSELCAHACEVEFPYQTPGKLIPWMIKHFAGAGISADSEVCTYMTELVSRDMTALANEIDKLCAYLTFNGEKQATKKAVEYVCCRIDEISAFDFSNALLKRDRVRAYEILCDMFAGKQKAQLILGSISAVYADLYRIRTMHDCGMTQSEISAALHMNSYRTEIYLRSARQRSAEALRLAIEACAEADLKLKSTGLDAFGVVSALVTSL